MVNGIDVWDDTFDGSGPVEACVNEICTVCADLEDLDVSTEGACGNVYLNASCLGQNFAWDVGQFQLGQCASSSPVKEVIQKKIVKTGAMRVIIQMLNSNSDRKKHSAARAVKALARSPRTRIRMQRTLAAGMALGPLCHLLDDPKERIRIEAMGALMELATDNTSNANMIFSSTGVGPILRGLESTNPYMVFYAAGLTWQIVRKNEPARTEFRYTHVTETLKRLVYNNNNDVRFGAEWISALLSPEGLGAPGV